MIYLGKKSLYRTSLCRFYAQQILSWTYYVSKRFVLTFSTGINTNIEGRPDSGADDENLFVHAALWIKKLIARDDFFRKLFNYIRWDNKVIGKSKSSEKNIVYSSSPPTNLIKVLVQQSVCMNKIYLGKSAVIITWRHATRYCLDQK